MTDAMGFLHHSNYARIYENARWECFRSLGLPYSEIENRGILMPVISVELKYLKPAFFDDEIIVEVTIDSVPRAKLPIKYKMLKNGEVINQGSVTLAFMEKGKDKACKPPKFITEFIENHIAVSI